MTIDIYKDLGNGNFLFIVDSSGSKEIMAQAGGNVEDARANLIKAINDEIAELASSEHALQQAKDTKQAELDDWAASNFIDSGEGNTGYEFPIAMEDRQSLDQYKNLLNTLVADNDIASDTPMMIKPVGFDGTQTITQAELQGLWKRYGLAILKREGAVATKTAEINACSTVAEVQAIDIEIAEEE